MIIRKQFPSTQRTVLIFFSHSCKLSNYAYRQINTSYESAQIYELKRTLQAETFTVLKLFTSIFNSSSGCIYCYCCSCFILFFIWVLNSICLFVCLFVFCFSFLLELLCYWLVRSWSLILSMSFSVQLAEMICLSRSRTRCDINNTVVTFGALSTVLNDTCTGEFKVEHLFNFHLQT